MLGIFCTLSTCLHFANNIMHVQARSQLSEAESGLSGMFKQIRGRHNLSRSAMISQCPLGFRMIKIRELQRSELHSPHETPQNKTNKHTQARNPSHFCEHYTPTSPTQIPTSHGETFHAQSGPASTNFRVYLALGAIYEQPWLRNCQAFSAIAPFETCGHFGHYSGILCHVRIQQCASSSIFSTSGWFLTTTGLAAD